MELYTTFDKKTIFQKLTILKDNELPLLLWQNLSNVREKFQGKISELNEDNIVITLKKEPDFIVDPDSFIFVHCEVDILLLFKRQNFRLEGNKITFKTPVEIKLKERRDLERFSYKYQDFKVISFSYINKFLPEEKEEIATCTLLDISTSGIGAVLLEPDLKGIRKGLQVTITKITDQEVPSGHKAVIRYIEHFDREDRETEKPVNFGNCQSQKNLIKIGIEFIDSLESVSFKSIASVISKKQTCSKGLKTDKYNGLSTEEQERILSLIAESNPIMARNIRGRIEDLDRLRYLTSKMKQEFLLDVNITLLARSLRLSSKELIYELLHDVTETIREEFLEVLEQSLPPSAINKAQDEIYEIISKKEKKGEIILTAAGSSEYV